MSFQPFPIADFKQGLFSAREIFLAPPDAFARLENAKIDHGVLRKREGFKTLSYFPTRNPITVASITETNPAVISGNHVVITGITQANPGVVTTSPAHGLSNGDVVVISGVSGMTQVNGNTYTVANKAATTFELSGTNTTGFDAYTSGGVAGYVHGLSDNDVIIIQSAGGMTGLNNNKYIVTSASAAANTFALKNIDTSSGYTTYTSGATIDQLKSLTYKAAISGVTLSTEDLPGPDQQTVITTATAHGLSTGDQVLISGDFGNAFSGMGFLNNTIAQIVVPTDSTDTFTMALVNTKGFDAWVSGGDVFLMNKATGNAIMGIHELFVDEADNELVVNSQVRTAKLSNTLNNLISVSSSDDFSGNNRQLFHMVNGYDKLWMTNFVDNVKTTDGTYGTIATETFDLANASANSVARAKFVIPFAGRMFILNSVEGATKHPQRVTWSRINYAAATTSEWDQVSDDSTANSLDAATDEELVDVNFLGDGLVLFFERSIWSVKKTGNFDIPIRFEKLADAQEIFSSSFSSSSHFGLVWALSRLGFIATDGIQEFELDEVIPRWDSKIDDGDFPIVFGVKFNRFDEYWLSYSDSGDAAHRNDNTLVYNYKDKTFYDYKFGFNCAGESTIADDAAKAWSDLELGTWGDAESEYDTWGDMLRGNSAVDVVIGDDYGRIIRLGDSNDDDGQLIPVNVETVRLNPFKENGQAAHMGYVDFLFDEASATDVEVSFLVDFNEQPLMTQTINLGTDKLFIDADPNGVQKVWKRVYTNLVGNTHQIKIKCEQQSSDFKLHAIVPYFKPAGRINLI